MLLKSTLLAAVLGLTLSQPVLGEWTKGASVELGEKDGKCTFHVKDYPRKGCSGTQTKADIEDHEKDIGKVKDGKCNADDSPIIFVKGCKHMHGGKPPFTYFVDGKHKGELMADSNDTVPIGFDIGTKATWNGEKWDVSKK